MVVSGPAWLAFPRGQMPEDPQACLEKGHDYFASTLPKLDGVKKVVGIDGELWSPAQRYCGGALARTHHAEHIRKFTLIRRAPC